MVKRVATGLLKSTITLAVVLLVLIAVVVGLARQAVYQIGDMHAEVAQFLSQQSGLHIEFDAIAGSWKGLAPRFQIEQLRVSQSDQHEAAIVARQVDLEVLLLQSVLQRQPRLRLNVAGLDFTLSKRNGRMEIDGLILAPSAESSYFRLNDFADMVSRQPRLSLTDSQLQLKGLYAQDVTLSVQQLQIESGKVRRYATGRVTLRGPSNLSFDLKAQVRGSLLREGSISGNVYLDAGFADWLPWIPAEQRKFHNVTLDSMQGGSESWLTFRKGKLVDATSRFSIHDFNLNSPNEVQPPRVKSLSGVARWQTGTDGNWNLGVENLRMVTPSFVWQPKDLRVSSALQENYEQRYTLTLDDAEITPWLNYFLALQPADGKLYRALKEVRPAGQLHSLALALQLKDNQLTDYRFTADLRQFNTRAWEQYPGLRDLDVVLSGQKDLLLVQLKDDSLELNYPYLFRDTLMLTRVDGTLALRKQDDGLALQSSLLRIHSNDMRSATQFALHIPTDPAQPPFMQLQSTLRDIDAEKKSLYLPAGIIPPNLLKWLDEGILSGRLARGDIVVHGPLGKDWMPYRRVLLGFTVHDAALRFLPDWTEPVQNLDADVIVDRGAVYGEAVRGDYFQQTLQGAQVTVPPVLPGQQHFLHVKTQTQGRAEAGFDILQKTPLASMVGDIIQDMDVQGDMAVDLDLAVPLEKGERKTVVDVDVQLHDSTFDLRSQRLQVSNLNADVHFDLEQGLSAPKLTGQSFAGPIAGSLNTKKVRPGGQAIQLDLHGKADVAALQDWLKLSVLAPLSGALDYQVELNVPTGEAKKHLHGYLNVTSQLKGTAVELPAPFGKRARTAREFRVWQSINREPSLFSVRYDDLFELSLQRRKGTLQKGVLMLGAGKALLPDSNIFRVEGQLGTLDLAQWQPVLEQVRTASKNYQENIDSSRMSLLDDSRLRIGNLILGERNLGAIQIELARLQNDWQVRLSGDSIAGTAQLPAYVFKGASQFTAQDRPVLVNLDHIRLPENEDKTEEDVWVPSDLSPFSLPNTRLVISDLQLGDGSFGRWALAMQRSPQGMLLNDVNVQMRSVELKAKGSWTDISDVRSVQLQGEFASSNIADVMRAWGSEPTLGSKQMRGNLNLGWPGAPFEFSLKRAQGDINVSVEDGEFYNVKSGVVGKFWGALNFETLMRRLRLNFKDLSEGEMVYDRIDAQARLDNGVLHVKEVDLDSPAIKLQTSGDINLHSSELDMVMSVTVPVTRNLVLPAAAIGGVPAAATVYVIEKVLGNQFDKLTTIKYKVTGNFDDPKVEIMDLFNIIPSQVRDAVLGNDSKPKAPGAPAP